MMKRSRSRSQTRHPKSRSATCSDEYWDCPAPSGWSWPASIQCALKHLRLELLYRKSFQVVIELVRRFQELQQVSHLLDVDLFFKVRGHRGQVSDIHLPDVFALDNILFALLMA